MYNHTMKERNFMKKYIPLYILVATLNCSFLCAEGNVQKTDPEHLKNLVDMKAVMEVIWLHNLEKCKQKKSESECWYFNSALEKTKAVNLERIDEIYEREKNGTLVKSYINISFVEKIANIATKVIDALQHTIIANPGKMALKSSDGKEIVIMENPVCFIKENADKCKQAGFKEGFMKGTKSVIKDAISKGESLLGTEVHIYDIHSDTWRTADKTKK